MLSVLRVLTLSCVMLLVTAACGSEEDPGSTPSPISTTSPVAAVSPTTLPTLAPAQPPAATPVPAVVDRLKSDLAGRLGTSPSTIAVVSLQPFVWPDGCLGIGGPGVVCTQALVPGWLAILRSASGAEYRYRGAGDRFAIEP